MKTKLAVTNNYANSVLPFFIFNVVEIRKFRCIFFPKRSLSLFSWEITETFQRWQQRLAYGPYYFPFWRKFRIQSLHSYVNSKWAKEISAPGITPYTSDVHSITPPQTTPPTPSFGFPSMPFSHTTFYYSTLSHSFFLLIYSSDSSCFPCINFLILSPFSCSPTFCLPPLGEKCTLARDSYSAFKQNFLQWGGNTSLHLKPQIKSSQQVGLRRNMPML